MKKFCAALLSTALLTGAFVAEATTLRWARTGDSLTLDPHAQNEGPTHALAHQIYEPLLMRDMSGKIIPALATQWQATNNPKVWRFFLRPGVKYHGGQDFTADDVVFSINRAKQQTSDMKELLNTIVEVRKVNDHVVDIETAGPNPLLPNNLTNLFIMDEGWTRENGAENVQDFANGGDNYAVRNANGTGAYLLAERQPDERTVLRRNDSYWGRDLYPMEVSQVIYTPIQNAATRVAALLSGEVDFIQDVPVQDLQRVQRQSDLKVVNAPQNRTIFFGMNVGDDDLANDNVEGKNPLADRRVREAMNLALDRDAIKRIVMRDQSQPTGVIMPPFVNGWTPELDKYPKPDANRAKQLLRDAGYPDGFTISLQCPNDRYINDEAICQAAVGMFGRIGVTVNLDAKPKAQHFPQITKRTTDFYLLGWGVPTFDSHYIFNFLVHTTADDRGSWNGARYSNAEVDKMIRSLEAETNLDARNATITAIWNQVQADLIYLPLHHQILNWGMKANIDFAVQPEDQPHFKFLRFN
jgi:peptide/nickel transport system substrate-binding protein